jgi:hypothetical protein
MVYKQMVDPVLHKHEGDIDRCMHNIKMRAHGKIAELTDHTMVYLRAILEDILIKVWVRICRFCDS